MGIASDIPKGTIPHEKPLFIWLFQPLPLSLLQQSLSLVFRDCVVEVGAELHILHFD